MAEAVEAVYGPCEGLVITRYGYARPCQAIEIVEAAHPVPDKNGLHATKRMLDLVADLSEDDTVLALIYGGASALLVHPAGTITLEEKQTINAALLASGATIGEMNIVRKHLSHVKGGQLARAAHPAKMLSLMISDVPGDAPAMIGSGPTVGDDSTPQDASDILKRYSISIPAAAQGVLAGPSGVVQTNDPSLETTQSVIYAAPSQSLEAAADMARNEGLNVKIIGDAVEGEARVVAAEHAKHALNIQSLMQSGDAPTLILSGGELTVTRIGNGIGGPNAEYALALALALNGQRGIHAIACDTDGVDGAADVAGALIGPETLMRSDTAKATAALANNDAHSFFKSIDAQVVTGPTLTNVNDFRAILVTPL